MYKVQSRNNKVVYRLQDFTKNDNVDESMFEEAKNNKGAMRLECQVIVLHREEFETLEHKHRAMKDHVETLSDKIKQQASEIKRLQDKVDKYEQAHKDEEFNIIVETRKLEKQHQNEVDELKENYEKQLLDIDETQREHLENISAHYTAKVNELNDKLIHEVKANEQSNIKLNREMLHLKEQHKDEVINLQNEHHLELMKVQHAHSDELQALQKQHTYDIDTLKQAIADIKQENLTEVNKIESRHHVEVDKMRSSFLNLLTVEHAQDIADFNDCGELPFYIKPFARGFIKNFNEFKKRKQLNTPQKIVETYELEHKRGE